MFYTNYNTIINTILRFISVYIKFILFIFLIWLTIKIIKIIFTAILFDKCHKPWWAALIPFYHTWIKCEIAGCHWIVFILRILKSILILLNVIIFGQFFWIIPLFAKICISYNISKKFNKDTGFFIGLVLLPFIFIPILALSKNAIYDKNIKVKNCAFFDINF